jgi:hypothetical protein
MPRHLGRVFVDERLQGLPLIGWAGQHHGFSWLIRLAMGGLLLSATNTAIIALVSVIYLMAKDDELPRPFTMLTRLVVPSQTRPSPPRAAGRASRVSGRGRNHRDTLSSVAGAGPRRLLQRAQKLREFAGRGAVAGAHVVAGHADTEL